MTDSDRLKTALARVRELEKALEQDRTKVAAGVNAIKKAVSRRHWLTEGRGSYAWDDDRWMSEFAQALSEIETAMSPLAAVAADWSNCSTDPGRVDEARREIVWESPDG